MNLFSSGDPLNGETKVNCESITYYHVGLCCRNVAVFPYLNYSDECNVITNSNDGKKYKVKNFSAV